MATPIIKIHNAKVDRQSTIHETLIHYFLPKHPQQVIFGFISLKLNNIMVKASHLVKMVSRWLAEKLTECMLLQLSINHL